MADSQQQSTNQNIHCTSYNVYFATAYIPVKLLCLYVACRGVSGINSYISALTVYSYLNCLIYIVFLRSVLSWLETYNVLIVIHNPSVKTFAFSYYWFVIYILPLLVGNCLYLTLPCFAMIV